LNVDSVDLFLLKNHFKYALVIMKSSNRSS